MDILPGALLVDCAGGAVIGAALGTLARLAIMRSHDEIVGLTISIALALSTYRLAIVFDVSGPIAVVVAGLVMINGSREAEKRAAWRHRLAGFWTLIDDLVNTLLFLLMGAELLTLDLASFASVSVLAAIPLAILSRFGSIALPLLPSRLKRADKLRMATTLTWVGLRGAVSIALVLTTPPDPYAKILAASC